MWGVRKIFILMKWIISVITVFYINCKEDIAFNVIRKNLLTFIISSIFKYTHFGADDNIRQLGCWYNHKSRQDNYQR